MAKQKAKKKSSKNKGSDIVAILIPIIIASPLPEILVETMHGSIPSYVMFIKLAILAYFMSTNFVMSKQNYSKFIIILIMINLGSMAAGYLNNSNLIKNILNPNEFTGAVGGPVVTKMIGSFLVLIILVFSYNTPKRAFLARGDLKNKVELITKKGDTKLVWRNLMIAISLAIPVVSIAVNFIISGKPDVNFIGPLISHLPVIASLAMMNSLAEGIMYRSSLVATLSDAPISKNKLFIIVGAFYGINSYFFVPGGYINVLIYSILGFIMAKSMYETDGFLAAWVMNISLSVVMFSSLYLSSFV